MTLRQWKVLDKSVFWVVAVVLLSLVLFVLPSIIEEVVESTFFQFLIFLPVWFLLMVMGSAVNSLIWRLKPKK